MSTPYDEITQVLRDRSRLDPAFPLGRLLAEMQGFKQSTELAQQLDSPTSSFDSKTYLRIFWRTDKFRSLWTIMRDELELSLSLSTRHIEMGGGKLSCYVDSGEWSYYRQNGALHVRVQCGSTSDRDCDGALCGLSYVIRPFQDYVLVEVHTSYNY